MTNDPEIQPEPTLVIYRPVWDKKAVYRDLGGGHRVLKNYMWDLRDLDDYNGYTDSKTGAESFVHDHLNAQALVDLDEVTQLAGQIGVLGREAANRLRALARLPLLPSD